MTLCWPMPDGRESRYRILNGVRKEARKRAAILYGIVAGLGVVLFHYRAGFSVAADYAVLIPYVAVVAGAALLGAVVSGWYFRTSGVFELVTAPILVIPGAAFLAGQFYALHNLLWGSLPPGSLLDSLAGGIVASIAYLYASAPILVPMAAFASYVLWRRYRFES